MFDITPLSRAHLKVGDTIQHPSIMGEDLGPWQSEVPWFSSMASKRWHHYSKPETDGGALFS